MPKTLDRSDRLISGFCIQAQQVSVGVKAVVDRAIKERTSMIIEGIHLLPGRIRIFPCVFSSTRSSPDMIP